MTQLATSHIELETEAKLAFARAITGVAGYYIGKEISKRTGYEDLSMVGLLLGYAAAPLIIKSIYKDQIA